MFIDIHVMYPLFLSDSNETWMFSAFKKKSEILKFMKICQIGTKFFHADGQT